MNWENSSIPAMSPEQKRQLVARLLKEKIRSSRPYPMSFAQERLWFLNQFEPGPAYNIPVQLSFPGPLHEEALHRALDEVVRRHEALRTTFHMDAGRSVQRIQVSRPVDLSVVDLRHLPVHARQEEAQRIATHEYAFHFDLERGPLFRATLVRLHDHDHLLLLTMHHIVSDGWSIGILMRELGALYEAFAKGGPSPLPELPMQYADFARQQRELLSDEVLAKYLEYWKKQLADAPEVMMLPTDRVRPRVQTYNGAWQPFTVGADVTAALQQISKRERVTMFMTLLAAFKVLLQRYTGQLDLVVGTPIANRNRAEIESLIGFFVNTVVLRTMLSPESTFREFLQRVREVTLEAYTWQDLPFEKLVEELQPERDLSHGPIFQVMFVLQNAPTTLQASEPSVPPSATNEADFPVFGGTAKFDVTVSLVETQNFLTGTIEYNTDLFEHSTISRMIGHFRTVLMGIARNAGCRISDLSLLTERERKRVLVEWNATAAEYPADQCLHELFERQADRVPGASAVLFGTEKLTYAELERRSNQLAHYLIGLGISADSRVGICLERSPGLVVGIIAILKAGAAYVPLDPAHPQDRLTFMLEDARVEVVLTIEQFADRLPGERTRSVCLDADWSSIAEEAESRLVLDRTPDNVVAMFYTSGSTGWPKGTLLNGRGFVNLVHWYASAAGITERSRVLLMTPFTFDASFKNIMTPLSKGGAVVLAEEFGNDVERLLETFREKQPEVTFATPSLLYALLDLTRADDYRSLSSLRRLFVGGEATDVRKLRPWLTSSNCSCQVIHIYGPSECSDVTTIYMPSPGELLQAETMPIGKPVNNVSIYVLDDHLNLQPVGVPGELCISGIGLAWGYFGRPGFTAEKFVPNPYCAGQRLYRTGDQVRWLPTGNIEFLGRTDNQVKIRGIRVELGEIEAALSRHDYVKDAVVVARDDFPGDKRLVAYVVPRQPGHLDADALRKFLRDSLPSYMVPAAIVPLDHLPLSPNGKVNRNALPAPSVVWRDQDTPSQAPRNPVEEVLAGFWVELLGLRDLSVHDNFFDLGGHSLLATQLVSRVREAFQVDIPLRRVFEAPTISELADSLVRDEGTGSHVEKIAPLMLKVAQMPDEEVDEWLTRVGRGEG